MDARRTIQGCAMRFVLAVSAGSFALAASEPGAEPPAEGWGMARRLLGHTGAIVSLVFSPDGNRLFSAASDGEIRVWDVKNAAEAIAPVRVHDKGLRAMILSASGDLLATAGGTAPGEVKVWDARTLQARATFSYPRPVYALALSSDGALLAAAGEHHVYIWSVNAGGGTPAGGEPTQKFAISMWPIRGLAFSPDGRVLLTGGHPDRGGFCAATGVVRAWEPSTGKMLGEIELDYGVEGIDLSRDGRTLAVAAASLEVFNVVSKGGQISFTKRFSALDKQAIGGVEIFNEQFRAVAFRPGSGLVAGAAGSPGPAAPGAGHVSLYSLADGRCIARLWTPRPRVEKATLGAYDVAAVAFSPDGQLLASGGRESAIVLWAEGVPGREVTAAPRDWPPPAGGPIAMDAAGDGLDQAVPEPGPRASAAARDLAAIEREFQGARTRFLEALKASEGLGSPEARKAAVDALCPDTDGFVTRLMALARRDPKDDAAFDALAFALFLCNTMPVKRLGELRPEVIRCIEQEHLADPDLSRVFYMIEAMPSEDAERLMRRALDEHPDAAVRAHACYSLARYFQSWLDGITWLRQDPRLAGSLAARLGEACVEKLRAADPDHLRARADELFRRVVAEFGEVRKRPHTYSRLSPDTQIGAAGGGEREKGETLRALAERALANAAGRLDVGHPAPEIEGKDIDGVSFKLSDYRGKAVVLVFSASLWCGACRAMHPQERALVARLKDRPFALLHVNADYNRGDVKRLTEKGEITWRSWWDGPGPNGPIAKAWGIEGWPTVYVLDREGVIRSKQVRGEALDRAVDAVLGSGQPPR